MRAGARLAGGTVAARLTGYLRSVLLVAALGSGVHADVFSIANTIPNMLVILLGAGIFNAVLVPQIVRADRAGEGDAFLNQIITLFGSVLFVGTAVLTLVTPLVVGLFVSSDLSSTQSGAAVAFGYFCLPQVFFYGVFALAGQILNARGVFGPMMWAPVANNVVAIAVLVGYLWGAGAVSDDCSGYRPNEQVLLGLGTTLGVVAQCVVLVPYLRRAGVQFRPTLRGVLSPRVRRTIRLGSWALAVVLVNQAAYTVIVRLAADGAAATSSCAASAAGTGYTVYSSAYLLIMAPHAIVTVSLTTVRLPGLALLASQGRTRELASRLASTAGVAMAGIVPMVAFLEIMGPSIAPLVWGYGAGRGASQRFVPTLLCFGFALVFFTAHYVALRGLYALEANRLIFGVQVCVSAVNVAVAQILVGQVKPIATAPALAGSYGVAYMVGAAVSWGLLRRRLGVARTAHGFATARVLLSACSAAGIAAIAVSLTVGDPFTDPGSHVRAGLACAIGALVFAPSYLLAGQVLRVRELGTLNSLITARLRRLRSA